jgi:lipid-A-disaccharide synthase
MQRAPRIFIVAGEASGDQLGYKLMSAIRALKPEVCFVGVGGKLMSEEGLESLFPMDDIAVMGFLPVIARLPLLLKRISQTAEEIVAQKPDVLVIIDSPDFTHRVARIVRKANSNIPIVNYVSPTVWAWRPGRAKKMRPYVDHLLALLPFEPSAHEELGGPACTYVGHPLIEQFAQLRPDGEKSLEREKPRLLVLPGSRHSEVARLLPLFRETVALLVNTIGPVDVLLPAVDRLADEIQMKVRNWPVPVQVIRGEAGKWGAFRTARAALAASGTVTLELALAQVPMVAAYKVNAIEAMIARRVLRLSSVSLPNIILGEIVVPEFIQEDCTPQKLSDALVPLMQKSSVREVQLKAFKHLEEVMRLADNQSPSVKAAKIVLSFCV